MAELRRFSPDDAAALRGLRLESLRCDPDGFLATADEEAARDVAWFRDRLSDPDPGCGVLGAWDDGAPIGMVGFLRDQRRRGRHKARLWGVWMAPAARGQGLGRALVVAAVEHLRSIGDIEQVQLSVATGQTAARQLYAMLGFRRFGLEPRAIKDGDRYLDKEHLVLELR